MKGSFKNRVACSQRAAQQINGREGETATLLFGLSVKLGVAWWRFRPTLSPPLDASLKKLMEMLKTTNGFARGAKIIRLLAELG